MGKIALCLRVFKKKSVWPAMSCWAKRKNPRLKQIFYLLNQVLRTDAFVLFYTTYRFCKEFGNAELFDLGTTVGVGDAVSKDHFGQG